jgi:methylthioribose-1-phosphate isomerase
MPVPTIYWKDGCVKLIDQTKLPDKLVYMRCRTKEQIWDAIKALKVRGAPAIGIAGGFGAFLGIKNFKEGNYKKFKSKMEKVLSYLFSARPTAVNLPWALNRMRKIVEKNSKKSISQLKKILLEEAINILEEDKAMCRKIASYGEKFIKNGSNVLTHCNAGGLATADYGTALSLLFYAKEDGKKFHVYVDETRPVLQGARLTAWELMDAKVPCTLICDNMSASLMSKKKIDLIIVGADRIAKNGDTANKIGTYNLACLAHLHKIPFYVVAPSSTFDLNISDGKHIPIEERNAEEVTHIRGKRIAPKGVKVYNPSFDVTPAEYITAFVTEKGIIRKPYKKNISVKMS